MKITYFFKKGTHTHTHLEKIINDILGHLNKYFLNVYNTRSSSGTWDIAMNKRNKFTGITELIINKESKSENGVMQRARIS